jgi:hypothetical protein
MQGGVAAAVSKKQTGSTACKSFAWRTRETSECVGVLTEEQHEIDSSSEAFGGLFHSSLGRDLHLILRVSVLSAWTLTERTATEVMREMIRRTRTVMSDTSSQIGLLQLALVFDDARGDLFSPRCPLRAFTRRCNQRWPRPGVVPGSLDERDSVAALPLCPRDSWPHWPERSAIPRLQDVRSQTQGLSL